MTASGTSQKASKSCRQSAVAALVGSLNFQTLHQIRTAEIQKCQTRMIRPNLGTNTLTRFIVMSKNCGDSAHGRRGSDEKCSLPTGRFLSVRRPVPPGHVTEGDEENASGSWGCLRKCTTERFSFQTPDGCTLVRCPCLKIFLHADEPISVFFSALVVS